MKDVAGWQGYLADDDGCIYSTRSGQLLKLKGRMHKGYLTVFAKRDGRQHKVPVHQLVLAAFEGERPSSGHEGRHLDGNPLNNAPSNLAWGTRTENVADAIKHGTHVCLRRAQIKQHTPMGV